MKCGLQHGKVTITKVTSGSDNQEVFKAKSEKIKEQHDISWRTLSITVGAAQKRDCLQRRKLSRSMNAHLRIAGTLLLSSLIPHGTGYFCVQCTSKSYTVLDVLNE